MQAFAAGHVVMVDIEGTELDPDTAEFLRTRQIRGVCLFRKNLRDADQLRRLTADLRAVIGPHALIGIDQEGGSVARITFLPQAPSAMALGAIGEEAVAAEVGAAVARGLRSLGINWNFAPVLDVNNNPDATGTLAGSLGYKVNDKLSITLDALNLNNPTLKYYAASTEQPVAFYSNGRQYYINARIKF